MSKELIDVLEQIHYILYLINKKIDDDNLNKAILNLDLYMVELRESL